MIYKYLLITLGTIAVAVGAAGIMIPGLPTTPFLLLAAALYARSSPRLCGWLLANRVFGKLIRDYRDKGGMTLRVKITAICSLWTMLSISMLITDAAWLHIALPLVGLAGTTVMAWGVKTVS